jgi:hypothetical protein
MGDCCPWCGAKTIEVTTSADLNGFDRRARFICAGAECHEWRDGEGPAPELPRLVVLA